MAADDHIGRLKDGLWKMVANNVPPEVACDWLEEQGADRLKAYYAIILIRYDPRVVRETSRVRQPDFFDVVAIDNYYYYKGVLEWIRSVERIWRTRQWTSKNTTS